MDQHVETFPLGQGNTRPKINPTDVFILLHLLSTAHENILWFTLFCKFVAQCGSLGHSLPINHWRNDADVTVMVEGFRWDQKLRGNYNSCYNHETVRHEKLCEPIPPDSQRHIMDVINIFVFYLMMSSLLFVFILSWKCLAFFCLYGIKTP